MAEKVKVLPLLSGKCLIIVEVLRREVKVDASKNLWANRDLTDSLGFVAEERWHGRSITGAV